MLDAFSRRVVGWSIDSSQTANLVVNALGMAIENRQAEGVVIHSDHGTQYTSWAFTRRALDSGLVPSMGSIGDCLLSGSARSGGDGVMRVWCQGFDQGCGFSRTAIGRNPWRGRRYRDGEDVVGLAWHERARSTRGRQRAGRQGRDDRDSRVVPGVWRACPAARPHDRTTRSVRDLSCFGRAVRLEVWCRRWRCREVLCATKTWTENVEQLDATAVLTRRAGAEACRQVGQQARPVAAVAREFGVCWWTVMNAVTEHGTPLVDSPDRVGTVTKLGVDETSFQAARPGVATKYVTGLVDLERRAMIDMTPGNRAADLRRWCANADPVWIAKIEVVATDLAESYRAGLSPHLDHVTRVADPFHVVRVTNRRMDNVRRRVQNEQLGHRGRKRDPLFKIRKILLASSERVTQGGADRMLLGEAFTSNRQTTPRPPQRIIPTAAMTEGFVLHPTTALVEHLVGEPDHMERISYLDRGGQHRVEHRPIARREIQRRPTNSFTPPGRAANQAQHPLTSRPGTTSRS